MVEVPEHLLKRSQDRRKDLGATTGDEPAADVPPSETAAAPAVAQTQAPEAATAPSLPDLPDLEPEPEPQPEPVKPWVHAAMTRKKIPVWAVPVLIFLPFWAIIFAGTLESPERDTEIIALGREVYDGSGGCAGCHGAEGGGGIGPALVDGEVLAAFNDWRNHVIWVVNGSPPAGQVYNDRGEISTAGMPSNGDKLSAREILAVVYFERVELGGAAEADLHDLEELFEAEGVVPNQFDIGQTFPSTLNGLMASAGIGAG
ncbi:MAG: c-type cytochrome [Acidimicrobiia bacterium]|nr:c-type cytochrome [Acidimicrobiia bacterium]MYG57097.1 c-type cytochrome [Acidimicrobiia bacterium]MYJ31487.1 c-type cytochrome [Acidimicrobiia bacterium]